MTSENSTTPPDSPPSQNSSHTPLFFADATLDLSEAHDIAETPEVVHRKTMAVANGQNGKSLQMPSLKSQSYQPRRVDNNSSIQSQPTRSLSPLQIEVDSSSLSEDNKTNFSRITSNIDNPTGPHNSLPVPRLPTHKPRWPRDASWATAFVLIVPFTLLGPLFLTMVGSVTNSYIHPSHATHVGWITAGITAWLLARILYLCPAGGEGEGMRQTLAQGLVFCAPLVVAVQVALVFFILFALPDTRWAALLPAWGVLRDVYLFRRWKRSSGNNTPRGTSSRQAFFQALCDTALDLLSRSLRRVSLVRTITMLLIVQWWVTYLWLCTLMIVWQSKKYIWTLAVLVAGKWATGYITRLLTLLASGGVSSWLLQQAKQIQDGSTNGNGSTAVNSADDDDNDDDVSGDYANDSTIPAAYRTVDASVYRSVADLEDVLDDDDLEDEQEEESKHRSNSHYRHTPVANTEQTPTVTVKSLLSCGLTVSFGSVAHCGLTGGLAQLIWNQLRGFQSADFRGMSVGRSGPNSLAEKLQEYVMSWARLFVLNHSDIGMSHVALFYKGYARAAKDVIQRIEETGVDPILHDDITTHMCGCLSNALSGILVLLTGFLLEHTRDSVPDRTDQRITENMILAFLFSYTVLYTIMEPLRSSIKAVYVSFAHHPECLSQAYPLIYHRLKRIADANAAV